jgi:Flp pilus assembly protein TadD
VAQNPKHIEAWNNLGAAYTMRGKPDDAEKAYDALLGLQPDDPTWLACRGEARLRQKKYSEAVADFRRALHVAPEGWEQRGAVEQRLKVAESK